MRKFQYHPEVVPVDNFSHAWLALRFEDLMGSFGYQELARTEVTFGFDHQFDRTIDEEGNPGEYVQAWMIWEDEEES